MLCREDAESLRAMTKEYADTVLAENSALDEEDIDMVEKIGVIRQRLIDGIEKLKRETGEEEQIQKILRSTLAECLWIQKENVKRMQDKANETRRAVDNFGERARNLDSYKKVNEGI